MRKIVIVAQLGCFLAIGLAAQRIQVTSPAAGSIWPLNSPQTITWIKSGAMDDRVFIRLYKDMEPAQYISEDTDNDGSFPWTVPGSLATGSYTIRVRTLDRAVKGDSSAFTIGRESEESPPPDRPSLQVLWPNGGETIEYGSSVKIRWKARNMSGASPVDISLLKGGHEVGILAKGLKADRGSFDWAVGKIAPSELEPGNDYLVRLRIHGTAIIDGSDLPFAIALRRAAGDLELKWIKVDTDGNVRTLVRSTFPKLNRRLSYEITRPIWAPNRVERKYLDLDFDAPGEKEFVLERVLATDLDMSGNDIIHSDYEIVLDPEDALDEANENNNRREAALCGHAIFPVIEAVTIGDTEVRTRNQTAIVRCDTATHPSGNEVLINASIRLRNYGYTRVEGEVRISQLGNQPRSSGSGPGGAPLQYQERLVTADSFFLAEGGTSTKRIGAFTLYMYPTDIEAELAWEGPGAHTHMAKFRFTADFSRMPLD